MVDINLPFICAIAPYMLRHYLVGHVEYDYLLTVHSCDNGFSDKIVRWSIR